MVLPAFGKVILILVFQAVGKYSSRRQLFRTLIKRTIPLGGKFFKVALEILLCPGALWFEKRFMYCA